MKLPLGKSAALALALVIAGAPVVLSQNVPPGGMPSKQEIEKRLEEEFNKLPDEKSELEGSVSLTYKAIPSDPVEALKQSGQMPPGANPEAVAKQFAPMVKPYIEKYAGKVGKLKVDKEFKQKSTKIPTGEYTFGLVMDEMNPIAITISGGSLKAPVQVPIKPGKAPASAFANLKLEVKAGKTSDEFVVTVGFAKLDGEAGKFSFKK